MRKQRGGGVAKGAVESSDARAPAQLPPHRVRLGRRYDCGAAAPECSAPSSPLPPLLVARCIDMARCRWLAGTATVAAGMAALATVAAGQPRRVLEGPPGVPSLWFKTVTESLSVYRVPGMEVPALARIVSSFMNLAFECTGTYDSSGVVYTDAFGQPLPAVADEADRTDVNVDLCAAAAVIGVKRRYFGDAVAEKMHAAGVKEGVDLPRTLDDCPDASVASPACYGLTLLERLVANHLDVDGYNELGTDGRRRGDRSPPAPYKDVVTGYKPVNKPGRVRHLTRWVPLVEDLWGWV